MIDQLANNAMPMTSQTTCSAGNLRRLALAFPVAARACSIHSGGNEEENVLMSSGTFSLKATRAALSLMIRSPVEIGLS
jgi:hypothetical protein